MACVGQRSGPAVYEACLDRQIATIEAVGAYPDVGALSSDQAEAVRIACAAVRPDGPSRYNACLKNRIRRASR